jgi:dynein heavy chain
VILAVSQIYWTMQVEEALNEGKKRSLILLGEKLTSQIGDIVKLVRGHLEKLERIALGALTVLDVHARDLVQELVKKEITDVNAWEWIAALRYVWDPLPKDPRIYVKMVNA